MPVRIISGAVGHAVPDMPLEIFEIFTRISKIEIDEEIGHDIESAVQYYTRNYSAYCASARPREIKDEINSIIHATETAMAVIYPECRLAEFSGIFDSSGTALGADKTRVPLAAVSLIEENYKDYISDSRKTGIPAYKFDRYDLFCRLAEFNHFAGRCLDVGEITTAPDLDPFFDKFLISLHGIAKGQKNRADSRKFYSFTGFACTVVDNFLNQLPPPFKPPQIVEIFSLYFYADFAICQIKEGAWGQEDTEFMWNKFGKVLSQKYEMKERDLFDVDGFEYIKGCVASSIRQRKLDIHKKNKRLESKGVLAK